MRLRVSTKSIYTPKGFRRLADRESRRGKDPSSKMPAVAQASKNLTSRREKFQNDIQHQEDENLQNALRTEYRSERRILLNIRNKALDSALTDALEIFDKALETKKFQLRLSKGPISKGKQTYHISQELDIAYPAKQASAVIRASIAGYSPSRNSITRALGDALAKKYVHAVYRLDIQTFFDSIPHEKLLAKIRLNHRIDSITYSLVVQLLDEFSAITGNRVGIPRGVGLSSQLAELYMDDFDKEIRTTKGVLFYVRYVDDIVIVLENELTLKSIVKDILINISNLGLKINSKKTQSIVTDANGDYPPKLSLNYLGYSFKRTQGGLHIELTDTRKQRRLSRINIAFEKWLARSPDARNPNPGLDNLLTLRIRYLAGNTKLANSKDSVAIGIFFSNSSLRKSSLTLAAFDTRLNWLISRYSSKMTPELRGRLRAISFVEGFEKRTFFRFNQSRLEQIVRCWKDLEV